MTPSGGNFLAGAKKGISIPFTQLPTQILDYLEDLACMCICMYVHFGTCLTMQNSETVNNGSEKEDM